MRIIIEFDNDDHDEICDRIEVEAAARGNLYRDPDEHVAVRVGDLMLAAKWLREICGPVPPDERGIYRLLDSFERAAWHGETLFTTDWDP